MAGVETGFAAADITPEKPCELAGYGLSLGRVWTHVMDPLYVRVLAVASGGERALIASFDVVGFTPEWAADLKTRAAESTGIPREHILLGAIHTHSAPAALPVRHCGEMAGEILPKMDRAFFSAVEKATRSLRPVESISTITAPIPELFYNRDPFAGEVPPEERSDPYLRALILGSKDTARAVTTASFHPVILGPNLGVSADWPGAFMRELEARGVEGLFLLGTHGDCDPIVQKVKGWGKGTVEDVTQTGRALAAALKSGEGSEIPLEDFSISGCAWEVDLPLDLPALSQAEEIADGARKVLAADPPSDEAKSARFFLDWAEAARGALERGAAAVQRVPLQILRLGPLALVGIPMEVYAGVGHAIRRALKNDSLWVISMANGAVNYLPTPTAYEHEAYSSHFATKIYGLFPYRSDVAEVVVRSVREHALS